MATKIYKKDDFRKREPKNVIPGIFFGALNLDWPLSVGFGIHFGSHFLSKIDGKNDAKIDAGKVMKTDENSMRKFILFSILFESCLHEKT